MTLDLMTMRRCTAQGESAWLKGKWGSNGTVAAETQQKYTKISHNSKDSIGRRNKATGNWVCHDYEI